MKTLYTRLVVLFFCCLFFSFSHAQVVCVSCYHQNDSISSGVTNLIQNGSFENTNCSPYGMGWGVYCPNASNYSCNLANWTCTGGGSSTYATTFDHTYCVVADGNLTCYFGNNFCNACSSSSGDVSCLVDSACVVNGLPSGYPQSINAGYGGTTGISISQTVNGLTPGNTYVLEFWAGGEWGMTLPGMFALDVGFGNILMRDLPTPVGDTGTVYVVQFIAAAASHTIKFTNWGHICQSCTELVLDNVRLYPLAQLSGTVPPCSNNIVLAANASPVATSCGQCNGSATASAVNGTGPFSYLWSNGQITDTLTAVCSGDYFVTITDAHSDTAVAAVTIASSGSISALIQSPDSSFCQGDSVQICSNGAFQTYLWSNGSPASCIYANTAANYVLTVTDANGCTAVSNTIPINVNPHPAVTASTLTPVICANDSSQVCSTAGFVSYFWNTGATTTCITATHAGNYYVTVTDANGCTAVSNHLAINSYPLSPVSVSVNGDTLTAFNAVTYQWYFNNQPINGATNAVYIATQTGSYLVEISDTNGCHVNSNNVNITVTGISSVTTGAGIKVYPNPSHNTWQLEADNDWPNSTIEVFDAEGRLVFKSEIENQQSAIAFDAARGIYTLHIYNHQKNIIEKLVRW